MPLRDILKKRDHFKLKHKNQDAEKSIEEAKPPRIEDDQGPEITFTFLRTTTASQEQIYPPDFPDENSKAPAKMRSTARGDAPNASPGLSPSRRRPGLFEKRSSSSISIGSKSSNTSQQDVPTLGSMAADPQRSQASKKEHSPKKEHRLSARLEKFHIGRSSRGSSTSSVYVPAELPEIFTDGVEGVEREAMWERRAALLAMRNWEAMGVSGGSGAVDVGASNGDGENGEVMEKAVGTEDGVNIQEAIRLHEAGDLEKSTAIFGRLADPSGHNDPLAQILYGMALQHGWGIPPSPPHALHYQALAASNAARIESTALNSGFPSGGPAKGELILAIYELGNAFRHGWGCEKDLVAARRYYECAAELGDVDAMVEVAGCLEKGWGGVIDKFQAARYLRMAEERGRIEVGGSWIWKDKYGGPKKPLK